MDEQELTQLIDLAQANDPAAYDRIVDAYAPRLYGYLYRLTGSRDDSDDLLQELFLRLVRMIGSYEHDGRFEGWLFRIATNLARDRIRRRNREGRTASLDDSPEGWEGAGPVAWLAAGDLSSPPPDSRMALSEDVDALQRALAELPAAEREVIMLRHFSQLSFAEIAEAMGTPLGTALARGHRGLAKLRQLMEPMPAEAPRE